MSIFEDNDKMFDNVRESARELGYHVPKMVKVKIAIASKKCNRCYGRGFEIVSFTDSRGNETTQKMKCKCLVIKEIEVPEPKESV